MENPKSQTMLRRGIEGDLYYPHEWTPVCRTQGCIPMGGCHERAGEPGVWFKGEVPLNERLRKQLQEKDKEIESLKEAVFRWKADSLQSASENIRLSSIIVQEGVKLRVAMKTENILRSQKAIDILRSQKAIADNARRAAIAEVKEMLTAVCTRTQDRPPCGVCSFCIAVRKIDRWEEGIAL